MKYLRLILAVWLMAAVAQGATYYVTPSGAGNGQGGAFTNAMSWATARTAGGAGNTYYLAAGNYTRLVTGASGTAGNPIRYVKATTATCGGVDGFDSAWDNQSIQAVQGIDFNHNYVVIDGVNANGINCDSYDGTDWAGQYASCVDFVGANYSTCLWVHAECTVSEGADNICLVLMEGCTGDYIGHSTGIVLNNGGFIDYTTDCTVSDCDISELWGTAAWHANVFYMHNNYNLVLKNNVIHDFPNGVLGFAHENYYGGNGIYIYGNVFYNCSVYGVNDHGGPMDSDSSVPSVDNLYCFNNTIYDSPFAYMRCPVSGGFVRNNIIFDTWSASYGGISGATNCWNQSSYATAEGNGSFTCTVDPFSGLAANNFNLNTNVTGANTPIDAGMDLSAWAAARGLDTTDINGNARGAGGGWDIGAYESGGEYIPPVPDGPKITVTPTTLVYPNQFSGAIYATNFVIQSIGGSNATGTLSFSFGNDTFISSVTNFDIATNASLTVWVTNTYQDSGTNPFLMQGNCGIHSSNNFSISGSAVTYTVHTNRFQATEGVEVGNGMTVDEGVLRGPRAGSGGAYYTNGAPWAQYFFTVPTNGDYQLLAEWQTPNDNQNSVWVNVNAPMVGANDTNFSIWDMATNSIAQTNFVTARGPTGTYDSPDYSPMVWSNLTAGATNYLLIYEREPESKIVNFDFRPWFPSAGTGQPPSFRIDLTGGGTYEVGTPLQLNFFGDGDEPSLSFWYQDGTNYPTEKSGHGLQSLAWQYADNTNAGEWQVVLSNALGFATSSVQTVTIYTPPTGDAPTFRFVTGDSTNAVGDVLWLQCLLGDIGTQPITFQWQSNGVDIAGATGPSHLVDSLTTNMSGDVYTIALTNAFGYALSNITITVGEIPYIISQPTNQTVTLTNPTALYVEAGGYAPLSYQWYRGTVSLDWGQTNAYTETMYPSMIGTYTVVITNVLGSVTSDEAVVNIYIPVLPVAPHPYLRLLLN